MIDSTRIRKHALIVLSASAVLAVGCASVPPNPELQNLETRHDALSARPNAAKAASENLQAANAAIANARAAREERKSKLEEHLIFVADKQLDIADSRIQLASVQNSIESASERRSRMLLDARTREVEQAESETAAARAQLAARERELAMQRETLERQRATLTLAQQQARDAELRAAEAELEAEAARAAAADIAAQLDELKVAQSERGLVLTLSDIVFDFDSATLKPGSDRVVSKIGAFLQDHENRKVVVEGFTDSTGSDAYNRQLSERRAAAVRDALIADGVDADRLRIEGFGEAYPVATNETDAGRALNRRVEVVIGDAEGADVAPRDS